jgi:Cutinase
LFLKILEALFRDKVLRNFDLRSRSINKMLIKTSIIAITLAGTAVAQSCLGQSCEIAAVTGSTGTPFPGGTLKGGTSSGNKCIAQYPGTYYYNHPPSKRNNAPKKLIRIRGSTRRDSCKPYTLLFARGTTETGDLGISVGPVLKDRLAITQPGKWSVTGIPYEASFAGDECLGLPGGVFMTQAIESAVANCPDSLLFISGYSEGAMVAHNGLAFSSPEAKEKVAVSMTGELK